MKKILLITLVFSTTMAISACSNTERKSGEYDSLQVSNPDEMNSEEKSPEEESPEETPEEDDMQEIVMTNPMIWADVPDPDIIRVGEYYYMVSTTMHFTPGIPIMRSADLVNWEIISYVYETLGDEGKHNLQDGENIYGNGAWAASLRYHEGVYYVCFASYDTGKTYIFQTESLEDGPWISAEINGVYHDPSILFDNDGRVYMIYGVGAIKAIELKDDLSGLKYAGLSFNLFDATKHGYYVNFEGSHAYRINGYYYIFGIEWPNTGSQRRTQWCYRGKALYGDFEGRPVFDDSFNYGNSGVAQGGIVDSPSGDFYTILFQNHGAVGRIPILLPLSWEDDWPVIGVDGKTPVQMTMKTSDLEPNKNIVSNDEFGYDKDELLLSWQWNHNPDNSKWSVTQRPGYLRIINGEPVENILSARNTLTQRTLGPSFTSEVKLDTAGMKPGDYAGIAAFQNKYGMLGVRVNENGSKDVIMATNDGTGNPQERFSTPIIEDKIYLKVQYKFDSGSSKRLNSIDKAYFYYSLDGEDWIEIDYILQMSYTLDHFTGYRTALFSYGTLEADGYADFDYYRYTVSEPYNDLDTMEVLKDD